MKRGYYPRLPKERNCSGCGIKIVTKARMLNQYCKKCNKERKRVAINEYLKTNKAKKVRYKYSLYYRKIGKYREVRHNRVRNRRQRALDNLGRKCFVCGYDKFDVSLDIHHKESKDKKRTGDPEWWNLSFNNWGMFVVLCRNCHHAYHKGKIERIW